MGYRSSLAVVGALAAMGPARPASAAFVYSTSIFGNTISPLPSGASATIVNSVVTGSVVTVVTGTGTTTVNFADTTRGGYAVPGADSVNLGDYTVMTTEPATGPGVSFVVTLSDTVTLANAPTPGTAATGTVGSFPISLALSNVSAGNGLVTLTAAGPGSASATVGGVNFTTTLSTLSTPTVNGPGGNVGGVITAAVPEPTAVAALASTGLVLLRRRRVA